MFWLQMNGVLIHVSVSNTRIELVGVKSWVCLKEPTQLLRHATSEVIPAATLFYKGDVILSNVFPLDFSRVLESTLHMHTCVHVWCTLHTQWPPTQSTMVKKIIGQHQISGKIMSSPFARGSKVQITAADSTCAAGFNATCMCKNSVVCLKDVFLTSQEPRLFFNYLFASRVLLVRRCWECMVYGTYVMRGAERLCHVRCLWSSCTLHCDSIRKDCKLQLLC
jgi:hypothetical protein